MRITGGTCRGLALNAPASNAIRPTSDKARLAIFNSLISGRYDVDLNGAIILDGTAGTGAMGIEALSRGAAFAHFADPDAEARSLVHKNLAKARLETDRFKWHSCGAEKLPVATRPCQIIFLDPPYNLNLLPKMVAHMLQNGWTDQDTLFVIEAGTNENIHLPLETIDRKTYGAAQVIYSKKPE